MDDSARGAYSAFNGLSFHLTNLVAALGLTLYGWIGSYGMSVVIVLSGFSAYLLFRLSFKLKEEREQEAERQQVG